MHSTARRSLVLIGLFALMSICALAAFGQTLLLPFSADDIDLLLHTGNLRAGNSTVWEYLAQGHNEHRMPTLRIIVYLATVFGNLDARPYHIAVLAIHICCAVLVTLIARPVLPWPFALLSGVLFCVSGVYSAMVIWAPTSSVFSLSLVFVLLAQHSLTHHGRIGVWLAFVALFCAMLSLNANILTVVIFCIAYWRNLGETKLQRAGMVFLWVIMAGIIFFWSSGRHIPSGSDPFLDRVLAGIRNGSYIVLTAMSKWFRAWITGSVGGMPTLLEMLTAGALAGVAIFTVPRGLRKNVVVLLLSACCIAMAIGYGRRRHPLLMIHYTDRYYYSFAAPLSLITAAVLHRLPARFATRSVITAVLILVLVVGAYQSRTSLAVLKTTPWIQAHQDAIEHSRNLAELLREESAAWPLRVPDGFIPFSGVHKDGMTLITIVYGMYPGGIPGLEVVSPNGATNDRRANKVFNKWARNAGWEYSPVKANEGLLQVVTKSEIDFRKSAYSLQVREGFHEWSWSARSRWMSKKGRLELPYSGQKKIVVEASAPASGLRKAGLITVNDRVVIRVNDAEVGTLDFGDTNYLLRSFSLPPVSETSLSISMESTFTWKASQINPKNADPRELSITLISVKLTD